MSGWASVMWLRSIFTHYAFRDAMTKPAAMLPSIRAAEAARRRSRHVVPWHLRHRKSAVRLGRFQLEAVDL